MKKGWVLLLALYSSSVFCYQINVSELVAYRLGKDRITILMQEIYAPLNIQPTLHVLPSQRGLQFVNKGIYDAEAGRVAEVAEEYANLVPVPEPLTSVSLAIFCLQEQHCKLTPHQDLVVIRGGLVVQHYCHQAGFTCHPVSNQVSALQTLQKGHTQRLLGDDLFAIGAICQSGLQHLFMRRLQQGKYHVHHYVHKKHQQLIPKLTASIQTLNNSGRMKTIFADLANRFSDCEVKLTVLPTS